MDLKDIVNSGPTQPAPASHSPPRPVQMPSQQSLPSTPVQQQQQQLHLQHHQPPLQAYHDYSQGIQASPGRHMSSVYASPPPPQFQPGGAPVYGARPPGPLQHTPSAQDGRSPSVAPGPMPTLYRHPSTASLAGAGNGYPLPPAAPPGQHPLTHSPPLRSPYPPAAYPRESYPQGPPAGLGLGAYGSVQPTAPPPIPQTPPIGAPGGAHPFLQHRPRSNHSSPTPAVQALPPHSQYGAPCVQGSPTSTPLAAPVVPVDPYQRQSSQPPMSMPMPMGAPMAGPAHRQSSTGSAIGALSHSHPSSPYQQRLSSAGAYHHQIPSHRASPPPALTPGLHRPVSSHSKHDVPVPDAHRRSQSQSERDRSLSVSPRTRIPSLPSSTGYPPTSLSDSDSRHTQTHTSTGTGSSTMDAERANRSTTPAPKRKLDDRDLAPEDLEKQEPRPPPFERIHAERGRDSSDAVAKILPPAPRSAAVHTTPPPTMPSQTFVRLAKAVEAQRGQSKKRKVYTSPPPWAYHVRDRQPKQPGRGLFQPHKDHCGPINGQQEGQMSRHASPEEARMPQAPQQGSLAVQSDARPAAPPPPPPEAALQWGPVGPWEPSVTGDIPQSSLTRVVADFLFATMFKNDDVEEIQRLPVQFEVEAKLGTVIDKATKQRLQLPVLSDCIVDAGQRDWVGFRSSMTEAQHQFLNEFLNDMVRESHPNNVQRPRPRVPVQYKHRKEIDRFFELPPHARDRFLPPCISERIKAKGFAAKVRVSYDKDTSKVLAKIVKVRVHDLDIYMPGSVLDCRISVNLEMEWDGPVEELEQMVEVRAGNGRPRNGAPDRQKDRLSYSHGNYTVDLTQVVTEATVGPPPGEKRLDKEHELEIEVDPTKLLNQQWRAENQQPHQYIELVDGLVNNVRLLARLVTDRESQRGRGGRGPA